MNMKSTSIMDSSQMAHSVENRLSKLWSNLRLSRKLFLAFSVLFVLSLVVAAFALVGLNRVQKSYEDSLAGGVAIKSLSEHLNSTLLEARRREKDFLLRWKDEGFGTAYNNYVVLNQADTAEMKSTLQELDTLASAVGQANLADYSQTQFESDIVALNKAVLVYEQSFTNTVSLIEQRGYVDTGLEGEFRTAVQDIEAKIYDREGLEPLVITMLQIRRREKDYLLRGDQQYVDNVHDLVAQLKSQVMTSDTLTSSEKTEISRLADEYLTKFDALVEKDKEIAGAIEVFRATAAEIQTAAEGLKIAGEQIGAQGIQTAQANSRQTFTTTGITVFVVLILALGLSLVLSRQITNPILRLTDVAHKLEMGDYDVQAQVTSHDEIGMLATTFNGMARRIKHTLGLIAQRASELQTVSDVSTAVSTELNAEKLLWNVSNLTKERFALYHAHIYLLNETGEALVLAAGAGDAGKQMVADGRRIAVDHEGSLVARAARERKGVIVNDVRSAPDFLPNPLLPDTRAELAVPMIVNEQVIGVFDVQSEVVDRFTQENVDIQTIMATQIAVALQNARSYTQVQGKAEREALIASIGQKIQRASTLEETLKTAIRELGIALRVPRVQIAIGTQNQASDLAVENRESK